MKKAFLSLIFIFTAVFVFAQTTPAVVVATFTTRGQFVSADDAESITELYIANLAGTGKLRVVDRSSLDRVIAEMRFQLSDWSDPQKTARLGASLNASILVRGQINQLGDNINVSVTALDIATLEVIGSATNSSYTTRDFFSGISRITYGLANDLANNISTRLAAAERARQEAARQQEQNQYSLVGTWSTGGSFTSTDNDLRYIINGGFPKVSVLTFYSDGSVTFNEQYIYGSIHRLSMSGFYTRQNNRVEISLSGTDSITSQVYDSRYRPTNNIERSTRNSTISTTFTIEFRNNGRELVIIDAGLYGTYTRY